jgi:hypothetical protein
LPAARVTDIGLTRDNLGGGRCAVTAFRLVSWPGLRRALHF